ncbi:MAG: hypothetical protein RLZZ479_386 [Bacteroidota bacterium]
MPQYPNRQFLEFETPIKELFEQIEDTKKLQEKNPKIDYSKTLAQLEASILDKRKELTVSLTPWQRVQLSRHPDRPYTLKYIDNMFTNFVELHGDRNVKDDKAMVGGFAQLNGETVMVAPAGGFYSTPGMGLNQVRIAYVLKKEDLVRAVAVLKAAIPAYNASRKTN